jgi:hypothetical protein
MAHIIHHHHTIESTPVCDHKSGRWKSSASVTWPQNGNARAARFLPDSLELFVRFEDAEKAGLEAGKNWVERKLQKNPLMRALCLTLDRQKTTA